MLPWSTDDRKNIFNFLNSYICSETLKMDWGTENQKFEFKVFKLENFVKILNLNFEFNFVL